LRFDDNFFYLEANVLKYAHHRETQWDNAAIFGASLL
jgi:hypothetical protein